MYLNGVSKATVIKAYKAALISGSLIQGLKDPGDGSPRSAYDSLVRGVTDCDPMLRFTRVCKIYSYYEVNQLSLVNLIFCVKISISRRER
jgi:hypothetical protein